MKVLQWLWEKVPTQTFGQGLWTVLCEDERVEEGEIHYSRLR